MNNDEFYKKLLMNSQIPDKIRIENTKKMLDEQAKSVNMKYLFITKEEVLEENMNNIEDFFLKIDKKYKRYKEKVFLVFDGWDNDKRELYEIKEIATYVRKFFLSNPHTLYYLSEKTETLQLILSCLGKYKTFKKIDSKTIIENINENKHRLNEIEFSDLTTNILVALEVDELAYSHLVFNIFKFFDDKQDFNTGYDLVNKINGYLFKE